MNNSAREWFKSADRQLKMAELAIKDTDAEFLAPVIATQVALDIEISLKAFLQQNTLANPHIHNLSELNRQCILLNPKFPDWRLQLDEIDTDFVKSRYPSDIPPTLAEVKVNLAFANQIRDQIETFILTEDTIS